MKHVDDEFCCCPLCPTAHAVDAFALMVQGMRMPAGPVVVVESNPSGSSSWAEEALRRGRESHQVEFIGMDLASGPDQHGEWLVLDEFAPIPEEAWESLKATTRDDDDDEFVKAISQGLFDGIPKPKDWRR